MGHTGDGQHRGHLRPGRRGTAKLHFASAAVTAISTAGLLGRGRVACTSGAPSSARPLAPHARSVRPPPLPAHSRRPCSRCQWWPHPRRGAYGATLRSQRDQTGSAEQLLIVDKAVAAHRLDLEQAVRLCFYNRLRVFRGTWLDRVWRNSAVFALLLEHTAAQRLGAFDFLPQVYLEYTVRALFCQLTVACVWVVKGLTMSVGASRAVGAVGRA